MVAMLCCELANNIQNLLRYILEIIAGFHTELFTYIVKTFSDIAVTSVPVSNMKGGCLSLNRSLQTKVHVLFFLPLWYRIDPLLVLWQESA